MFDYLLPNVFKKIGLGVYLLSVFFVLFATKLGIDAILRNDLISIFAVLGFGLIINSKEKDEDERTMICRYKALGKTFRSLLIFFLIMKFGELIILEMPMPGQFQISFFTISLLVYYGTFEKLLKNEL
ncbi:MAG: hypothetical protein CFE21_01290 [Bacteroidetes bacterium B1(2017)]|nr:MAG: hypothetical protein CFE21_01290 [Bacteroidetes bacterium B1(2017)]